MQGMIGRRIAALAVIAAAIGLSSLALFAIIREGPEQGNPALLLFYSAMLFHVPLAMLVFALVLFGGKVRQRLGLASGQIIARTAPVAVTGFFAFSVSADIAAEWSGVSMKALEELEAWIRNAWFSNPALAFLTVAIIPGFVEELALRGYLLNLLKGRLGVTAALILSSLLFGLLHIDPLHSTVTFFMGIYFGILALLTGGIWVPVLAHAFNNFMAILAAAWQWDEVTDEFGIAVEVAVFVVAMLISAACLAHCARTVREIRAQRDTESGIAAPGEVGPGEAGPSPGGIAAPPGAALQETQGATEQEPLTTTGAPTQGAEGGPPGFRSEPPR